MKSCQTVLLAVGIVTSAEGVVQADRQYLAELKENLQQRSLKAWPTLEMRYEIDVKAYSTHEGLPPITYTKSVQITRKNDKVYYYDTGYRISHLDGTIRGDFERIKAFNGKTAVQRNVQRDTVYHISANEDSLAPPLNPQWLSGETHLLDFIGSYDPEDPQFEHLYQLGELEDGILRIEIMHPTERQRLTAVVDKAAGGLMKSFKAETKTENGDWQIHWEMKDIQYDLLNDGTQFPIKADAATYRNGLLWSRYTLRADAENIRPNLPAEDIPDSLFEILPENKLGITVYNEDLRMEVRNPDVDQDHLDEMIALVSHEIGEVPPSANIQQSGSSQAPAGGAAPSPSATDPAAQSVPSTSDALAQGGDGRLGRRFWIVSLAVVSVALAALVARRLTKPREKEA